MRTLLLLGTTAMALCAVAPSAARCGRWSSPPTRTGASTRSCRSGPTSAVRRSSGRRSSCARTRRRPRGARRAPSTAGPAPARGRRTSPSSPARRGSGRRASPAARARRSSPATSSPPTCCSAPRDPDGRRDLRVGGRLRRGLRERRLDRQRRQPDESGRVDRRPERAHSLRHNSIRASRAQRRRRRRAERPTVLRLLLGALHLCAAPSRSRVRRVDRLHEAEAVTGG